MDLFQKSIFPFRQSVAAVALASVSDVQVLRTDSVPTRRTSGGVSTFAGTMTMPVDSGSYQGGWKERASNEIIEIVTSIATNLQEKDALDQRMTQQALNKELNTRGLPSVTIHGKTIVTPDGNIIVPIDAIRPPTDGSGVRAVCMRVKICFVYVCVGMWINEVRMEVE